MSEKNKFYEDLETSVKEMIDSDLNYKAGLILAYSDEKTFNSMYGNPMDIIHLISNFMAGGDPFQVAMVKMAVDVGLSMRKDLKGKESPRPHGFGDLLKEILSDDDDD